MAGIRFNRDGLLKKHTVILCLLLCAVMFTVTGCKKTDTTKVVLTTGLSADEVFRIESISCTKPEIMVYLTNMQNQYENVYGPEIWNTEVEGKSLEDNVKDNALAKMAQVKTMNLMAESMGITLDAAEEKKVEKAADIYFDSLNNAEIEAMGIDRDIIYSLYREYLIAQKVYQEIIKDINPEVSDDEARNITIEYVFIKTYSQDGTGKKIPFTEDEMNAAYERAEEVYDRAQAGDDFDSLIAEYNEDKDSVASYGKRDIDDVAVRNILFDMANEEISPVLRFEDGYMVAKIISTYDLDETDLNKITIVDEERETVFGEEYDNFVAGLTRKLNDTLWENITFIHDEEITTSNFFEVADNNL